MASDTSKARDLARPVVAREMVAVGVSNIQAGLGERLADTPGKGGVRMRIAQEYLHGVPLVGRIRRILRCQRSKAVPTWQCCGCWCCAHRSQVRCAALRSRRSRRAACSTTVFTGVASEVQPSCRSASFSGTLWYGRSTHGCRLAASGNQPSRVLAHLPDGVVVALFVGTDRRVPEVVLKDGRVLYLRSVVDTRELTEVSRRGDIAYLRTRRPHV